MRKDTIATVANLQFDTAVGLTLSCIDELTVPQFNAFPLFFFTHTRGGRPRHLGPHLGSSSPARQLPQMVGRRRRLPGLPLRLLGLGRRLRPQLGGPAIPGAHAAARRTSGFRGSRCSSSARDGGSRCSSAARRGGSRSSSANGRIPGLELQLGRWCARCCCRVTTSVAALGAA
ncbi:uncharacterized protein [Triticum aestivum]|uniref:uncharacterized protein n=1 Tax=Triticum aestivum TaxID=4565 RepID=UPI001D01D461|nr:uncharacterized protein LOC123072103 [Triticum aestivum]